jgi:hypothetical protein
MPLEDYNGDGVIDVLDFVYAQNEGLFEGGEKTIDWGWGEFDIDLGLLDQSAAAEQIVGNTSYDWQEHAAPDTYDLGKSWYNAWSESGGDINAMEDWWESELTAYAGDSDFDWGTIWEGMSGESGMMMDPEAIYHNPAEFDRIGRKYKSDISQFGSGFGASSTQAHRLGSTGLGIGSGISGYQGGDVWSDYQRGVSGIGTDYSTATQGYWEGVGSGIIDVFDLAIHPSGQWEGGG